MAPSRPNTFPHSKYKYLLNAIPQKPQKFTNKTASSYDISAYISQLFTGLKYDTDFWARENCIEYAEEDCFSNYWKGKKEKKRKY